MSYAPQNVGFFDTIQLYFMELTGRAIMFSGRDMELLCRWRDQGATTTTICRGIREAVASMEEGEAPRGIRGCERWIEIEVSQARERSAGRHHIEAAHQDAPPPAPPALQPAPRKEDEKPGADAQTRALQAAKNTTDEAEHPHQALLQEVLETIERAGQACQEDSLRDAYRGAWRATRELIHAQDLQDPFSELAAIEDALAEAYFRALDQQRQTQIAEKIAAESRAALALMSPHARERHLAARRRSLLIREHGLTRLID